MADIDTPRSRDDAQRLLEESCRRVQRMEAGETAKPFPPPAEDVDPTHFHPHLWVQQSVADTRKRARNKGLKFALSAAWILKRLARIGYSCELSGIAFSARRPRESHKRPWMPSLDRIDCTKGYTEDNVRIVCVAVNTLLQDWGDSVFHDLIKASRERQP